MANLVPPGDRPEVLRQADLTLTAARERIGPAGDRARVAAAAAWLSPAAGGA